MGRKICEEAVGIKIIIPGEPQGKGRPRFSRVGNKTITRTPDNTVLYENLVKVEYMRQGGDRFPTDAQIEMHITAYYGIPKSATKKMREQIESGLRPTKKPDMDNIAKVIADALNGYAYRDDAQIVRMTVEKYYSTEPRVEVEVMEC